jgi:hypothetical protein
VRLSGTIGGALVADRGDWHLRVGRWSET